MIKKFITIITVLIVFIPSLLFSQKIDYISKGHSDSNSVKRYSVKVKYPQISNYKEKRVQDLLNATIQTEINKIADDFIKDVQDWDISDIPSDFSSDFDCDYTVSYSQNDIFSIDFEIYTYYAGAAHPYSYSYCLNLDLERMKKIDLTLMFKNENLGLKKLSDYCFKELKDKNDKEDICTDDEWLKEGTKPEIENFKCILIEPNRLRVIFNSYQVACYAAGPQEVLIPYSELKGFINPSNPLSSFIK